jgi:hypothetical protein
MVSFNDMAFSNMFGQRWWDVVKYMLAIDLDQAYAPWLTTTGNLTANLEVLHTNNSKTTFFGNDLQERQLKNDVSVLFNFGTSWRWPDFEPNSAMISPE